MARIYYFLPDFEIALGGMMVAYSHVKQLRAAGFDALIAHRKSGFVYPFAPAGVPVIHSQDGFDIDPDDWIVLPEGYEPAIVHTSRIACGKVLFCQNHFYIPVGLEHLAWEQCGINHFMAVSEPIRAALRAWFGVDAAVVRPSIDLDRFSPAPRSERPSIAYMPRKGAQHATLIRCLFDRGSEPSVRHLARQIEWRPIEGMMPDQVAKTLSTSWMYLSTGHMEGLGLPPLEAMAAGAIVVGFRADGGADYATDENGIWVTDEATFQLADAIKGTLADMLDRDKTSAFDRMRAAGRRTAERYSAEQERSDLIRFWAARLSKA